MANLEVTGNITLNGVNIFDIIYPIGSLYLSVTNTNPETLFGGTWEQIKDKFILAAGDVYHNGDTGGSKDAVVVSHSHSFSGTNVTGSIGVRPDNDTTNNTGGPFSVSSDNFYPAGKYSGDVNGKYIKFNYTPAGSISSSGESGTDKNMPPYLVVNVWKRTA